MPMPDAIPTTTSALDEETARAELYGLLAQLFYAPPSSELAALVQGQLALAGDDRPQRPQPTAAATTLHQPAALR